MSHKWRSGKKEGAAKCIAQARTGEDESDVMAVEVFVVKVIVLSRHFPNRGSGFSWID
jgi:hypothetical protein